MIGEADDFNPKKIYDNLIKGCREVKVWEIKCIVEESWVIKGVVPFTIRMVDGIYNCSVLASSRKEALIKVADFMPVILFVSEDEEGEL
tara:strand:- start:1429 stop:1695 length:267 start_codon:yes stop_codon:yes gene_type:complete